MEAREVAVTLRIEAELVPLDLDPDGVVRVRGSRVTLDTVVSAFRLGATPEEILQQYPSLQLADVYAVIAYYLRRQADVEAYLGRRRAQARRVRERNKARFDRAGVRRRLLARRVAPDDPPGG